MLLSHLFVRHKTPAPRFAPGLFVVLLAAFTLVGKSRPAIGLMGLGTTTVIASVLVILNRQRIWENYRKGYKKQKGIKGMWTQPNQVYYTINVAFLWPFILFLGVMCLLAAYALG